MHFVLGVLYSLGFFVHVACGSGLVLLWWCCNRLYNFGFTDDAMFSYHGSMANNLRQRLPIFVTNFKEILTC